MPGTPNPQIAFITQRLTMKLSQPIYRPLFQRLWADQAVETQTRTAAFAAFAAKHGAPAATTPRLPQTKSIEDFAAGSVLYAFGPANAPKIVDPVVVAEPGSTKPITLYRVFDGNLGKTLGGWWCSEAVVRSVLADPAFAALRGDDRASAVCRKLAQEMFVHPSWNACRFLAKMELGDGRTAVAIAARGDWQALKAVPGITSPADLVTLGMQAQPGAVQYFVPLVNPMFVTKVPNALEHWPFS